MNYTEKRRQRLLEQTRRLYTDKRGVPAVHPRYKAAYHEIYPEDTGYIKSTFGLRVGISVLLFATFILMKQDGAEILGMDNIKLLETIVHNYQIKLY